MDLGAGNHDRLALVVGIDAPSANVDLGNAVDDNVSLLKLSNAELGRLNAPSVSIG